MSAKKIIEETRPDFETYFVQSRKSKGVNRSPNIDRLPDDTYVDNHAQRHWWTWQNAIQAAIAQGLT